MRRLVPLLIAAALTGAAVPAAAQSLDPGRAMFQATTVSLAAYGEARLKPDTAVINVGVQSHGETAAQALALNRTQMAATVAALKRAGVADRDIQTSGLSLQAQYTYRQNEPPLANGYQVSNTVTVRLRDMERVGSTVDALVAAGANQINGISFTLDDPRTAEAAARRDAVAALQAKAAQYAQALGYRVVRLVNLSEGAAAPLAPPAPVPMLRVSGARLNTPVEAGELTVRVDVTGLYELAR